jgi:two-component system phosphate regulon sensor histidine kinase PhoR
MDEHVPPGGDADLVDLVEDVTAFLRPQLDEKTITLDVSAPETAMAIGDRDQLTEVLLNLVENAIKYSPEGGSVAIEVSAPVARDQAERPPAILGSASSRLTLAAPSTEPGERYVAVRVRDSGRGIERSNLPRLSERFFRVGGQKSGPKEGTGLGLAIVKHIVNRHRGGFTVESAPGAGSVFSVFFPVRREQKESSLETAS